MKVLFLGSTPPTPLPPPGRREGISAYVMWGENFQKRKKKKIRSAKMKVKLKSRE
jgi:hypothetical protein